MAFRGRFRYAYACDGGSLDGATYANSTTEAVASCVYDDGPGSHVVRARIIDKDDGFAEYTSQVMVQNVAPSVGAIAGPVDPLQVGTTVAVSASFSDPGAHDSHSALWSWGDGTSSAGVIAGGTVSGGHAYPHAGLYTITLVVTDDDGEVGQAAFSFVVVYDPNGGHLTAGGWFASPAGAYALDPALMGKIHVSLNAKYHKGATSPKGQTQITFEAAKVKFHSTRYDWLVVSGTRVWYRGQGTINGGGSYGFLVSVADSQEGGNKSEDRVRVRIWDQSNGAVVYDSQPGASEESQPSTTLTDGSITIHNQ